MSLTLENVSYGVRGKTLVHDLSFDVKPGQVLAVVGPNGAGKSTSLKLLCGDLAPTAGRTRINGQLQNRFTPMQLARLRAVLPQASNIVFRFRVHEIVAMGCMPHGEPPASDRSCAIVDEAMHMAACWDLRGRDFTTLSGGEQQRVQMARVIAQIWPQRACDQPRYLLLDEPTSALDLVHQIVVMKVVKQFAGMEYGVMAVLHDLNLAWAYADQIVVLEDGQIRAQGAPDDVLEEHLIEDVWGVPVDIIAASDQSGRWVRPRMVG